MGSGGSRALLVAALGGVALACAPKPPPPAPPGAPPPAERRDLPAAAPPRATYAAPNVRDADGTPGFVHVTPADMPLRVSIGLPQQPPRYGSRADGRRVAIEAMQQWQAAIAPELPWFRLEFAEEEPRAAVQVRWKRRIVGPWGGFGTIRFRDTPEGLRVGGEMQLSTTPDGDLGLESRLSLDEVRLLVAHEFGHVLGLGHCLDCDSAMNYAWNTLGRVIVTDLDVRSFVELVSIPNGTRVDGRPLSGLGEDAPPR